MDVMIDVLSWALLLCGSCFILIGGIGVIRLPDLFTRMHAASLTDSFGTILILVGIMLQSGATLATVKLASILLFMIVTGPTATYALANAAFNSDESLNESSVDSELPNNKEG